MYINFHADSPLKYRLLEFTLSSRWLYKYDSYVSLNSTDIGIQSNQECQNVINDKGNYIPPIHCQIICLVSIIRLT